MSITGKNRQPDPGDVISAAETAVNSLGEDTQNAEIAFFGGSFTAINREYMISLLQATVPYIDRFHGIRISTRPDFIDDEVLSLLKSYKVTSVELGAQSMCDDVLSANNRGHLSGDVVKASELIKKHGMSLGLQMMTGLYMSDDEKDIFTAEEFIRLKPDTVRIYPTIVMKNTELGKKFLNGEYSPQTLDDAVSLCSFLLRMFHYNEINVIRVGLHDSDSLARDRLSGPYHPSFRELCESKLLLDLFYEKYENSGLNGTVITVAVNPRSVSKFVGNRRKNLKALEDRGFNIRIEKDSDIDIYDLVLS